MSKEQVEELGQLIYMYNTLLQTPKPQSANTSSIISKLEEKINVLLTPNTN